MSQVNWTQLTKAMVLIRSLAFSGSSWALEVGRPRPHLATSQVSASQGEKVPLFPMQHLHGPWGILSCAAHPCSFALWERKPSTKCGKCKPAPLSLPVQTPVPVLCQLWICPHSLSSPAWQWAFCPLLERQLVKGFVRYLASQAKQEVLCFH